MREKGVRTVCHKTALGEAARALCRLLQWTQLVIVWVLEEQSRHGSPLVVRVLTLLESR